MEREQQSRIVCHSLCMCIQCSSKVKISYTRPLWSICQMLESPCADPHRVGCGSPRGVNRFRGCFTLLHMLVQYIDTGCCVSLRPTTSLVESFIYQDKVIFVWEHERKEQKKICIKVDPWMFKYLTNGLCAKLKLKNGRDFRRLRFGFTFICIYHSRCGLNGANRKTIDNSLDERIINVRN